jgi:signal peptidase I
MCPTLNPAGDIVLVNKMTSNFKHGDVVIATSPSNFHKTVCKRITAIV